MALVKLRLATNISGDFFVDSTCIDCDLCRQIAPMTFSRIDEQSAVYHQPANAEEELAALKALITCPTASIGELSKRDTKAAVGAFPELIADNVFFCGFAAESSFGASSYLIQRQAGNLLIDSPRFSRLLVKRIEELGGIKQIFLTHRDDVADHVKWAAHFNAERILHNDDMGCSTQTVERILSGYEETALDEEVLLIPTPGHTRGHVVLLYKNRFLLSGDHVWWSANFESLYASPRVCWYNWDEQIRSMARLLDYDFEWVLPGHGRRFHAAAAEMKEHLKACLTRMQANASRTVAG